ncbi:hypothetical protein HGM15179_015970, partial [Zosterops borbonicus]
MSEIKTRDRIGAIGAVLNHSKAATLAHSTRKQVGTKVYLQCYCKSPLKLKARFCLPADQMQKKSTDFQGVLPDLLL